jgi:hypothetical protein
MIAASMIDVSTLGIVLGGRCWRHSCAGFGDCRLTLIQLGRTLARRAFDPDAVRARIARVLQEIERDGLLRTKPRSVGDAEFDAALDAMVVQRAVGARARC